MKHLPYLSIVILSSVLSGLVPAVSAAEVGLSESWPPDIAPPGLKLVFEGRADLEPSIIVGESDKGERRIAPITGGVFHGEDFNARIRPGGADWQLIRDDGVWELVAIYSIVTDDDVNIIVENRGLVHYRDDEEGNPTIRYIRSTPKFMAPVGKYDWLNKSVFVGTVTPGPNTEYVVIRIFEVL